MNEGVVLYKAGLYQQALKSFLSSDLKEEDYSLFSYHLGMCYVRLQKYEEALLYLEQTVGSNLDIARMYQCRMLLGFSYAQTKQTRLSALEFKKLIEDGYESAKVYAALGHVLSLEKKHDESINYLEQALKLDPGNTNALNSMGYVLAETGNRLNLAFLYCSKAVRSVPNNPAYLDSLGWVLFKLGKQAESVGVLNKAFKIAPQAETIKNHLWTAKGQIDLVKKE